MFLLFLVYYSVNGHWCFKNIFLMMESWFFDAVSKNLLIVGWDQFKMITVTAIQFYFVLLVPEDYSSAKSTAASPRLSQ